MFIRMNVFKKDGFFYEETETNLSQVLPIRTGSNKTICTATAINSINTVLSIFSTTPSKMMACVLINKTNSNLSVERLASCHNTNFKLLWVRGLIISRHTSRTSYVERCTAQRNLSLFISEVYYFILVNIIFIFHFFTF